MVNLQPWYSALRRQHIVDPVLGDWRQKRNPPTGEFLWGYDVEWVKWTAIGGGQADFDKQIKDLEPKDLALLYSYFNQKGHVEELVIAFEQLLGKELSMDGGAVIDVGCGPFTAGLALANVVGATGSFEYFGADRAVSMCNFGHVLAEATRDSGALHGETRVQFLPDVKDVSTGAMKSKPVLVVLSYLLASETINVDELTGDILSVCDRMTMGPIDVLYTNSPREKACRNFPGLKQRLEGAGFDEVAGGKVTLTETSNDRDVHYALFHRGPTTDIPEHLFK